MLHPDHDSCDQSRNVQKRTWGTIDSSDLLTASEDAHASTKRARTPTSVETSAQVSLPLHPSHLSMTLSEGSYSIPYV